MTGEGLGAVLILGLLVGLDNLQVGAGLGLVEMSRRRRWAFAASFGLAETVMPLVGLLGGRYLAGTAGEWADAVGIAMLTLTGLVILGSAVNGRAVEVMNAEGPASVAARVALPISLSFDNLFAGAALGALGFPVVGSALIIGFASGGLCAFGLFAGARIRRWVPRRAELLSGAYLLLLAGLRLIGIGD